MSIGQALFLTAFAVAVLAILLGAAAGFCSDIGAWILTWIFGVAAVLSGGVAFALVIASIWSAVTP